jgi:hypothetical protein
MLFSDLLKCYYPISMDVIGRSLFMKIRNAHANAFPCPRAILFSAKKAAGESRRHQASVIGLDSPANCHYTIAVKLRICFPAVNDIGFYSPVRPDYRLGRPGPDKSGSTLAWCTAQCAEPATLASGKPHSAHRAGSAKKSAQSVGWQVLNIHHQSGRSPGGLIK